MPSHKYSLITLLLSLMLAAFAQNLSQVQNLYTSPPAHPAVEVAYSPDGSLLAIALRDEAHSIKILDADSGREVASLVGHTREVNSVAFSPDASFLASGSADSTVKIWRTNDFSLVKSLEEHTDWVRSVAFSPAGDFLASGSDDTTVKIWRTADFSLVDSLKGHGGYVYSVAFSPAGDFLASGSTDNTVKIWRTADFSLVDSLEEHTSVVESVAFSPAGDFLASGSFDSTVKIWRTADFSLVDSLEEHTSVVSSVAFSPAGDFLASGSYDNTVKIWHANDSYSLHKTIAGTNSDGYYVGSVAFHPAGTSLAIANKRNGHAEGVVSLWGTPSRQAVFCPAGCGAVQYVDVTIYSTAGARVVLDGRVLAESSTGVFTTQLGAGTYQVQASKDGYRSASGTLEAQLNRANQLVLILQENPPELASLTIYSTAGANVTVDGQALAESSTGVFTGRFGVGSYNVSVSKADHQSRSERVDVAANRRNDFNFILARSSERYCDVDVTQAPRNVQVGAERRVALVVGNNDYDVQPLDNPVNDARCLAQALRNLGFTVLERLNLDRDGLITAVEAFEGELRSADVGLIFFAGHGLEIDGENYLLPIDISFEQEHQVKYRAMSLSTMLRALHGGDAKLSVVLLDACRNNPFSLKRSRSGEGSGGLVRIDERKLRDFIPAPISHPVGTAPPSNQAFGYFIGYATAPGSVAEDGDGYNSPYTQRILQHIYTPDMEIEAMFKQINSDFLYDSSTGQTPWKSDNIVGSFSFAPTR